MAPHRGRRPSAYRIPSLLGAVAILLTGCASPGPPKAPTLAVPEPVADLTATRSGDAVSLRFTLPTRTTDGQPLRPGPLTGTLCRISAPSVACLPVHASTPRAPLILPAAAPVVWTDELPAPLRTGAPRVLAYRLELRTPAGRTAGFSDSAYVAGGAAPPPVAGLEAVGVRQGIALQWTAQPNAGEVLLERQGGSVSRSPASATTRDPGRSEGTRWFQAAPGNRSAQATLDATPIPDTTYTYIAVRRTVVQFEGRTLELRSAPSAPVSITWREIYPPAAPTGLTALGYTTSATQGGAAVYAVDLIWQPVLDDRLAGYLVYREPLGSTAQPAARSASVKLTPQPIATPGFHDATAQPGQRYRYRVTAIDPTGNESQPAVTDVNGTSF